MFVANKFLSLSTGYYRLIIVLSHVTANNHPSEFGQHLRDPIVYCVDDGDDRKATGRDDVHPTVDASTATAAEAVAPGRYDYLRPTISPPSSPRSTKLPC